MVARCLVQLFMIALWSLPVTVLASTGNIIDDMCSDMSAQLNDVSQLTIQFSVWGFSFSQSCHCTITPLTNCASFDSSERISFDDRFVGCNLARIRRSLIFEGGSPTEEDVITTDSYDVQHTDVRRLSYEVRRRDCWGLNFGGTIILSDLTSSDTNSFSVTCSSTAAAIPDFPDTCLTTTAGAGGASTVDDTNQQQASSSSDSSFPSHVVGAVVGGVCCIAIIGVIVALVVNRSRKRQVDGQNTATGNDYALPELSVAGNSCNERNNEPPPYNTIRSDVNANGHTEPPEYDAIIDVKCDTLGADPRASHKRDVNYDYAFVAESRCPASTSQEQGNAGVSMHNYTNEPTTHVISPHMNGKTASESMSRCNPADSVVKRSQNTSQDADVLEQDNQAYVQADDVTSAEKFVDGVTPELVENDVYEASCGTDIASPDVYSLEQQAPGTTTETGERTLPAHAQNVLMQENDVYEASDAVAGSADDSVYSLEQPAVQGNVEQSATHSGDHVMQENNVYEASER